jgi:hypothetical protein
MDTPLKGFRSGNVERLREKLRQIESDLFGIVRQTKDFRAYESHAFVRQAIQAWARDDPKHPELGARKMKRSPQKKEGVKAIPRQS